MMEERWKQNFHCIDFSPNSSKGPRLGFASGGVYVTNKTISLWVKVSSYFKKHVLLLRGW
jgi:hypothetical protein